MATFEGHEIEPSDKKKDLKVRIKMVKRAMKALEETSKRLQKIGVPRGQAVFCAAEMLGVPLGYSHHGGH